MTQGSSTYTKLKCDSCNCLTFVQKFYLATKEGSGTHQEFAGWRCAACNADVDMGKMIERQQLERLQEEVRQKQAELAARGGVPKDSVRVQDKATVSLKEE